MEKRYLEFRLNDTQSDSMVIEGVVNSGNWSKELTSRGRKFIERIEKQAFQRAIDEAQITGRAIDFLFNHNGQMIMASTRNNSLTLQETENGLEMRAELCDTQLNRDAVAMIKSKLIDGFSFGFSVNKNGESWIKRGDLRERVINSLSLFEVSAVFNPAYGGTFINARDIDNSLDVEIPSDEEIVMSEVRAMDTETFEKFKQQLKEEILAEMQKVDEVEVQPEPQVEEVVEPVVEEIQEPIVEVVEEQPQEEVSIDIEEEPTPVVEEEKVEEKPFDTSEYLEKINQLKSQKEEV